MKIICDNCRTKYSIADEKVKGKVFKIRCKKCSNIIVVRGNQPQPEAAGDDGYAAAAAGGEGFGAEAPTWHLVVDQKQVGPMTASEVRDRFARGEIDAETYIWREGFSDWLRISQVEDFSDIAQSTMVSDSAPAGADAGYEQPQDQPQAWSAGAGDGQPDQWGDAGAAAGGGGWDAGQAPSSWSADDAGDTSRGESDNLFGGGQPAEDPGRDLFGTGEGDPGYAPGAASGAPASEGGLFGAAAAAPASAAPAEGGADIFGGGGGNGGQQLFPHDEEPQPASAAMTGQRNENSVLFSLTNLQALAMGGGGGGGGKAAAPAAGGADGSGLIDIRSMAGSSPAPAAASSSGGEEAGLPDLGGFSAPIAAAPVLIASGADDRPKWLIPTLVGGGVVLVGAITALVIVLVVSKPEPVPVAVATPTPTEAKTAEPKKDEPKPATKDETKTATAAENAAEGETKDEKKEVKGSSARRRRSGRRTGRRSSRRSETRVASRSEPAPAPRRKPRSGKRDALDDLIDGAVGSRKSGSSRSRTAKPAPSADANLPETLSRSQIQGGMRGIKGKVQGCYDRYKVPGMANVQVRIGRAGRVNSARVVGMFAGTPTGACVQAAARSARFPRFKGSPITITYPFILR
jgi:predicted Zn finger-like uncharacterized protein